MTQLHVSPSASTVSRASLVRGARAPPVSSSPPSLPAPRRAGQPRHLCPLLLLQHGRDDAEGPPRAAHNRFTETLWGAIQNRGTRPAWQQRRAPWVGVGRDSARGGR
eukprot:SAG25_NODE_337_length_9543_cov_4.171961_2_plen_107_part_00